jgi:hypothetical protein
MISLKQFIAEEKNTHMTHIEELIFLGGVDGTREAINFLRDLRDMLKGNSTKAVDITVKWDGAPAIFAGIDPADKKFFVAKKGLFAKTPKMYKTNADIDNELSGDLAKKFKVALAEFSKLGIRSGVYQGDLMFTKGDVKIETVDGQKYYTFQPNTIVYAVPVSSKLGRQIAKAKIGIVWHTTYTGSTIQNMKASFGKGIVNKFKKSSGIWMDDATYRDISGKALFTPKESAAFDGLLSQAGKLFRKVDGDAFRTIQNDDEMRQKVMTFVNTYVRSGSNFPASGEMATALVQYLNEWYQKEIDKKKSEKGKESWKAKRDEMVEKVIMNKDQLVAMFDLMKVLVEAKGMVIAQFDKTQEVDTLLRTAKGFEVTRQEGFVAIDKLKGGAVKLVDRLEFSRANFSPEIIKGWQK